jgi:hypothetical protein
MLTSPFGGSENVNGYDDADPSGKTYFTDTELPVRPPGGFGKETPDPAGRSLHRGHGWEYIELVLHSITQEEIGDNPNGPGEIAITDTG